MFSSEERISATAVCEVLERRLSSLQRSRTEKEVQDTSWFYGFQSGAYSRFAPYVTYWKEDFLLYREAEPKKRSRIPPGSMVSSPERIAASRRM
jgi:hypothetical protein